MILKDIVRNINTDIPKPAHFDINKYYLSCRPSVLDNMPNETPHTHALTLHRSSDIDNSIIYSTRERLLTHPVILKWMTIKEGKTEFKIYQSKFKIMMHLAK